MQRAQRGSSPTTASRRAGRERRAVASRSALRRSWTALIAVLLAIGNARSARANEPPAGLLRRNFRETPYSAHVRVVAVERAGAFATDDGRAGMLVLRIRCAVIELWKGPRSDAIEYLQTVEAPGSGPSPGTDLVVSLARRDDGALIVPDNGYAFPASDALLRQARRLARTEAAPPSRGADAHSAPAPGVTGAPGACTGKKPCRAHPALRGACFRARGRLSAYNGAPSARIWPVGSTRLLGVSEQRFADPGVCNLPDAVARLLSFDQDVFADFVLCPFTPDEPGVMRFVCVDSASHVAVRARSSPSR
jgi:hypothetical protein